MVHFHHHSCLPPLSSYSHAKYTTSYQHQLALNPDVALQTAQYSNTEPQKSDHHSDTHNISS